MSIYVNKEVATRARKFLEDHRKFFVDSSLETLTVIENAMLIGGTIILEEELVNLRKRTDGLEQLLDGENKS